MTQIPLDVQDVRILTERTVFQEMDALRKTTQPKKDFVSDQDSTRGPGLIDNIIRNILTVNRGSLTADPKFGLNLDQFLFEQLDWANMEFLRTLLLSQLNQQLPQNIRVRAVDISAEADVLNISVSYQIKEELGLSQQDFDDFSVPGTNLEHTVTVNIELDV